ncbi:anaerobic glycerol-3-phosphate dehydrogenase subunit GlpB [Aggregatilinea lenta]|uniref:anaerobic glycerol-3-phosphate dehydrogenase subunit GlpB n=1 Tax=Aggregatilinea lenta TaxID=913108 RepID=UPI000E5BE722|nr:anaerobic glycerol-3-phosphate dehydrogenase subunit GlpB [Aggregatilinea lenta]
MSNSTEITPRGTDILVIGAGLAGLTAAALAVRAGASVRLIAKGWGQQMIAPGWISVADHAGSDVLAAAARIAAEQPDHPYARAGADALPAALDAFCEIAETVGLPYARRTDGRALRLPTALGAIQTPLIAPRGLAQGDLTDIGGPVLLVGFNGWRDFHPDLAAGNLRAQGIDARAVLIDPPEFRDAWDMWPGDFARQMDNASFRQIVAQQVRPHAHGAAKIGFPAVLGLDHPGEALDDLAAALGCPVFEIPALPPSTPGVRLSSRLRTWLLRQRARVQIGHPVVRTRVEGGRCVAVEVEGLGHVTPFYADQFILATGGLYGGGLLTDDTGRVWEPLFGLPLVTPGGEGRTDWYGERLLQTGGHAIHRSGVRVDASLRPVDAADTPVLDNVRAVGHLLAGFNPLTDGCAEGVDLVTAYQAVRAALAVGA